jgi:hypothetical protein
VDVLENFYTQARTLKEEFDMSLAAEILDFYLKHQEAIEAELVSEETWVLRNALGSFAAHWKHAQAILQNPRLLERGEERYQAETAIFPVLEAMLFTAQAIPESALTKGLYRFASLDNEDGLRTYFIDEFMEKQLAQWRDKRENGPESSFTVKWGRGGPHLEEGLVMLRLRRAKVARERTLTFHVPGRNSTVAGDLKWIGQLWEKVHAEAEGELSFKHSWPSDAETAARRAADAIFERATPAELEALRSHDKLLVLAYRAAVSKVSQPDKS